MFIAMNHFQVDPNRGAEFEAVWRDRDSHLDGFDGFVEFALLKGDEPGEYISHSTWASRAAFLAWAQSDAFRKAHGDPLPEGIIVGHPRARFWDAILVQPNSALAPA